jgi:hypothetical protein
MWRGWGAPYVRVSCPTAGTQTLSESCHVPLTAAILFTALVSAPLHAGDVVFEAYGTVSSASAPSGPFVG